MERIIDSHVHLGPLGQYHPDRIALLETSGCGVVSWAFAETVVSVNELKSYLAQQAETVKQLGASLPCCHFLSGIHPRNIPMELEADQVAGLLMPQLEDPVCKGIGEIGLASGIPHEKEILTAQLELAREHLDQNWKIGIHTPQYDKVKLTRHTLAILSGFPELTDRIVIDHCNKKNLNMVLDAGFMAGVTIGPDRLSPEDLILMMADHADGADRMMCNSDAGTDIDDGFLQAAELADLAEPIRQQLFHDNAARFFEID